MWTGHFLISTKSPFYRTILPVLGGVLVAGSTAVIMRLSTVWLLLVPFGLVVFIPSIILRERKLYWLIIFIFALPQVSIHKMLVGSQYALALADRYGQPAGAFPYPQIFLSDLPFIVLLLIWFLKITTNKDKIYFPKSNIFALAFLGWSALSIIGSPLATFGLFHLIQLFKYYLVFLYFANNINSMKELKVIMFCLLIGVLLQGMFCFSQYYFQDIGSLFGNIFGQREISDTMAGSQAFTVSEGGSTMKRGGGTVGSSNTQAQFFVLTLPLALSLSLLASNKTNRLSYITVFIGGLIGLIFTFSRAGLLAAIGAFLMVVLISNYRRLISSKMFSAIIFCSWIGILISLPKIYELMTTRPEAFWDRFDSLKVGWNVVKSNPFFGVGLNNSVALLSKYDREGIFIPTSRFHIAIHNWYLVVAGETGILGLIFVLSFFSMVALDAYRSTKSNDIYIASIALGILAGLIGIFIHMGADVFRNNAVLVTMWMFAGLAVALNRINLNNKSEI